jgi:DNA-binding GntR family transcriptional regulator
VSRDDNGTVGEDALGGLSMQRVSTAHQSVTGLVRLAIISGDLAAGTRLVQSELAQRMRVSTTPIREALRELTTEGLVDFDPFRGAIVHTATLDELLDVYEIRKNLVPLSVARGVPRISDKEIAAARALATAMRNASTRVEWVELNRRLHHLLDGAAGSPPLTSVLGRLADLATLYVNLSVNERGDDHRRTEADEEHDHLLDAYEQRDVPAATALMLTHLEGTITAALPAIDPTDASRSTRVPRGE